MMLAADTGALALPHLHSSIPSEMHIPGKSDLAAPLAIALLEARLITDAMLMPGPNAPLVEVLREPDELELSMRALTAWWDGIQYPAKYFRWNLHVQDLDDLTGRHESLTGQIGWFCLTRDDNFGIPRFALRRLITELEATREGFGQTVLAVLLDATRHLPDSLDPWRAESFAEWLHWHSTSSDAELLEMLREDHDYLTTQEVLDDGDVMTREKFYADMPRWVTSPKIILSHSEMLGAARNDFESDVIDACDAICNMTRQAALKPHEIGSHQCGQDSVDGCMVLLWTEGDQISRAIDDGLNALGESGEYAEFIDAHPVPLTAEGIRTFQARTKKIIQLAALTERLLDLIGDPL